MLRTTTKKIITFEGIHLLQAREAAGLSGSQLAEKVDFWSQPRISQLESSTGEHEISEENLNILNAVI